MKRISWFGLTRPPFGFVPKTIAALATLLAGYNGYAAAAQKLHDHVPPGMARLQPLGRLPSTSHLSLSIGLPLRNRAALEQFIQTLYDPKSPNYRHYLTQEQFTANYGPSEQDYKKVVDFVRSNGLKVTSTYSNRVTLDVEGQVSDVEKALHVTLRRYQHPTEAREFFAPDAEPSLELDVPIAHIDGLDNYYRPKPADCCGSSGDTGSSYGGTDFRDAYCRAPNAGSVTSLTGSGQSVGLFQLADYHASDITAYENKFNLPHVNVVKELIGGEPTDSDGTGNRECSLDIEMVIAMAPGVSTVYVYVGTNADQILQAMVANNGCKQFGCSWDWGDANAGSGSFTNAESLFVEMQAQGQSFFDASGDSYAQPTGNIPYPDDSPNVTLVGGTELDMSFFGSFWQDESVWNSGSGGSTGGPSPRYAIPYYQQGISMTANHGSTTKRNSPDVAMVGHSVWVSYGNGQTTSVAGTSIAAPLWAGYMALVNQLRAKIGRASAGFINPAVYAIGKGSGPDTYANCFNDITSGNSESSTSPNNYSAVAGYDLCTGWGTPSYPLLNALAEAEKVYWVDLTVTDAEDPFPSGTLSSPFWYLKDGYPIDNGGALANVPSGAQIVFEQTGSLSYKVESSSVISGTGISKITQNVRISAAPGVTITIEP